MKLTHFTAVLAAPMLALSAQAVPQEPTSFLDPEATFLQPEMETQLEPGGWMEGDFMTGDWFGFRDTLRDSGVNVFAFYNSIINGNVVGGTKPGHATYVQDAWAGIELDLEKLIGWNGATAVASGIYRQGADLTAIAIGSQYSVQQVVGGQTIFLYQAFLEQEMTDQLTLKIGRYGASDDFNASPLYGYSLNNGINGNIRNVLYDTRFSAYPFSVWAASLFYEPTPEVTAKLGIFQTSYEMFNPDDHGVNLAFNDNDGFTLIAQLGWSPEFNKRKIVTEPSDGKNPPKTEMKGMPGHYWIGGTWSSFGGYQRFDGGFEDMSFGFYAHADQMVFQESPGSDQGLTAWVATGFYPQEEISIVPFQLNVGLNYKGLIPGRDDDRTIFHFIYGQFSRDYARSVEAGGGGYPQSEKIIEAGYRIQLTPWAYIQPDVQYVINPGGTGNIPNALVIGPQMGITF